MTKDNRVAIVGHGPASLAAAWAAQGMGREVVLYGPMTPSVLRGPLLLQRPVPGITVTHPDGYIAQHVIGGSILDYRSKLYGDVNISINGDILEEGYHAWKMEETYEKLWEIFQDRMVSSHVDREVLNDIQSVHDFVINTAPAKSFCTDPNHRFVSKEVRLTFDTMREGQEDNSIYFNAIPEVDWVRSSSVFGNRVTEWPPDRAPDDAHPIWKPISTDCDCWPRVFRTGRFGAWKNETWVDTAYYDTRKVLLNNV